jgi:hypothetical protein
MSVNEALFLKWRARECAEWDLLLTHSLYSYGIQNSQLGNAYIGEYCIPHRDQTTCTQNSTIVFTPNARTIFCHLIFRVD